VEDLGPPAASNASLSSNIGEHGEGALAVRSIAKRVPRRCLRRTFDDDQTVTKELLGGLVLASIELEMGHNSDLGHHVKSPSSERAVGQRYARWLAAVAVCLSWRTSGSPTGEVLSELLDQSLDRLSPAFDVNPLTVH
jgi:hypothetical protein